MFMKRTYLTALTFIAALFISACSKKDDTKTKINNPDDGLNAIEKMVIGKWKFESSMSANYDYLKDDCKRDDIFTFTAEKTFSGLHKYTVDRGTILCPIQSPTNDFEWEVIASDSTFDFSHNPPSSQYKCKIKSIDNSTMVLKVTSSNTEAITILRKI